MDQGYGGQKGWALPGFHLSAGASLHSLLDSWLSAPLAPLGRDRREAPGDIAGGTAAEGAVAAGSDGKGWSRSRR